jgi:hypothetical protein
MNIKKGRDLAAILGSLDDDTPEEAITPPAPAKLDPVADKIVPINVLVTPADRKRLRQLSLDTGLSIQKLGHEAWNDLLKGRGLAPLEPVTANVPSGLSRR